MRSTAAKPNQNRQFSLRSLMILVTIVCITLAFPSGHLLLGVITLWLILGSGIVLILFSIRHPLYRFLSGLKK